MDFDYSELKLKNKMVCRAPHWLFAILYFLLFIPDNRAVLYKAKGLPIMQGFLCFMDYI